MPCHWLQCPHWLVELRCHCCECCCCSPFCCDSCRCLFSSWQMHTASSPAAVRLQSDMCPFTNWLFWLPACERSSVQWKEAVCCWWTDRHKQSCQHLYPLFLSLSPPILILTKLFALLWWKSFCLARDISYCCITQHWRCFMCWIKVFHL